MKKALLSTIIIFIYSFASGQDWTQLSDTPFLLHHSNGFGFEGKAYVLAGTWDSYGPSSRSDNFWEYDPVLDSWTQLADFPGTDRSIAIGDELDGLYYYGFGSSQQGYLNDLWVLDPTTLQFTQLPSCPCQGRSHPAFVAHNDKIFMGSGTTANGDLEDWWVYDIPAGQWTQKANIPGDDRHHPFQFAIGDFVYVGGGHALNWSKWDIINETWSAIDDFPDGRVAGSQFSYGGKGYLLGGDDENHVHVVDSETFLQYDPEMDEWIALPELPLGSRWANSSFIIDSALYYFGGLSDVFEDDQSMWVFDMSIYDPVDTTSMDTTVMDTTMVDTTSTFVSFHNETVLQVSPNPIKDVFHINSLQGKHEDYTLLIFDSKGSTVMKRSHYSLGDDIYLEESISTGIYYIKLESDGHSEILKIVKD